MIIKGKVHYCEMGDMYLSENMNKKLSEVFENKNERKTPENTDEIPQKRFFCVNPVCQNSKQIYPFGGNCPSCNFELFETTLYCPECGIPMKRDFEDSFDISCVVCGKSLKGFYYRLIEFHPHKPFAKDFGKKDVSNVG